MSVLKGVTWGHRRAISPLVAASSAYAKTQNNWSVEWRVRSLQEFEHQNIEDICRTADLVVYDHPHVAKVERTGAMLSLEDLGLPDLSEYEFIGKSAESYRWAGKTWAVPVDGATIHALYRSDCDEIHESGIPQDWESFLDLARKLRLSGKSAVLAAVGHHGLLTYMSLCANAGVDWSDDIGSLLDRHSDRLKECLEAFCEGVSLCHPMSVGWNAVDVHEAMENHIEFAYCPAAYGYATYGEIDRSHRISFGPFPGLRNPFSVGTMIGGAGLGVSGSCTDREGARNFLSFLLEPNTQELICRHHGQSALQSCWENQQLDSLFNGYFSSVGETARNAHIRPRFFGYQAFETAMGEALVGVLASEITRSRFFELMAQRASG